MVQVIQELVPAALVVVEMQSSWRWDALFDRNVLVVSTRTRTTPGLRSHNTEELMGCREPLLTL